MQLSPSPFQTKPISSKPYFSPSNSKTLILINPKSNSNSNSKFKIPSFIHCSTSNPQTLPHSAIQRIADKLRSLGFTEQNPESKTVNPTQKQSEGEIFIPLPTQSSKFRVGHTLDPSWSTPENPVPEPGSGNAIVRYHELRKVVKEERHVKRREPKVPTLAELNLSSEELRRLRRVGIEEKRKLKVGKAGITEGIVNGIHERWRSCEVVKIICEDLCKLNMKRTHDLLERKTGGLVVWRTGSKIVLYRGANYKYPYFLKDDSTENDTSTESVQDSNEHHGADKTESLISGTDRKRVQPALIQGVGVQNRVRFQLPGEAQLVDEADSLLEGLGPRFTDWWGYEPLPIDADLLPAVVPGYQKPFRLLPYGVKPILTNDEMTTLKRLGRPLPCHFVLGRNRKHQGLAAAIVKLWEKCEIAKIAVKRGVQNTNSELMAEELKWLTGGVLLSRDREYIVLYRGKDFLPSAVSSAIKERRKLAFDMDKERRDQSKLVETEKEAVTEDHAIDSGSNDDVHGTKDQSDGNSEEGNQKSSTEAAIRRTSIRLSMALEKKAKAEKLLAEIENSKKPQQLDIDKEGITEEERYMLRKIGLKMKPFLLMGRRGIFDGTIENMHLHWKYRELVKIICKERSLETVHEVAQTLEAESGGILVAVERDRKGYAIIVYRGKNYQRPAHLRPQNLLSKREAMKRSLEAQRSQSLKLHVLRLAKNINNLKLKLAEDTEAHRKQKVDGVKDEKILGSTIHVTSNSELNSTNNSLSMTPVNCKESVELIDGSEVDIRERGLFSESESEETISFENCSQTTAKTYQADPSFALDGIAIGEVDIREHGLFSESASEETNSLENCSQTADNTNQADPSLALDGSGICNTEPEFSSEPMKEETHSEEKDFSPLLSAVQDVPRNETKLTVETAASESQDSLLSVKDRNERPPSKIHLSNRDRLMLRKQALKMKKRPVLAVGRSNIVTGVANTIKEHFKRYPLAIVNVKGRAKGTSVQEVVFQLEQATGGVLVSQEPSKVILYRGWGAFDEPAHKGKKNTQNVGKISVGNEGQSRAPVSPELMAAIRLECGLQNKLDWEHEL